MKIKETIGKCKSHPFWGRYGGSAWSAVTTSAFAAYNIFLGALFVSAWHISAGVYYAFLAAARCTLIVSEAKNFRESDRNAAEKRERRTFYGVSVFTLFARKEYVRLLFSSVISTCSDVASAVFKGQV